MERKISEGVYWGGNEGTAYGEAESSSSLRMNP